MAAEFIGECLDHGNFDAKVMSIWHQRWMDKFGSDYKWSVSSDQHCLIIIMMMMMMIMMMMIILIIQ